MVASRGKRIAAAAGACCLIILIAAVLLSAGRIKEEYYIHMFETGSPEEAKVAAMELARTGSRRIVPLLVEYLPAQHHLRDQDLVLDPWRMVGSRAVPDLLDMLRSGGPGTRERICWLLGSFRWQPDATVPVLGQCLRTDPDPSVRQAAAAALEKISSAR